MFDDFDLISAKEMQDRQKSIQDKEIVKKVIKRVNNYLYDLSEYQNTKGYIIFQNRDEQKNRNEIISILKRKGYHIEVIKPSHYYEWGGIQISW